MADQRLAYLLRQFSEGDLNRRQLFQRAMALGLSASTVAAVLAERASAAPGNSPARVWGQFQTDAATLVIADNMAGGLWLSLDPGRFYEVNPTAAMNVIYETLYHIPDGSKPDQFEPLLAEGMPELSADGREAMIKLRPGVKFHTTGNEMTAEDWVFSWNRLKNLKAPPSYLTSYWETVEAVDATTLKITLPTPNPALVAILSSTPLSVTDSATVQAQGGTDAEGAETSDTATEWLNANSTGTGPYLVSAWDVSTEVVIERNPDYWGEAPKLDRIIWRNIATSTGQLQAVQTGEADIAYYLDPDAVGQVEGDPNLQLLTGPTINLEYLAMHSAEDPGGPVATKEVRQAIAHAVDYDGIINDLLGGAAIRPPTIVPLPMPGSEAVQDLTYQTDLERAQALFDAAGAGEVELQLSYRSGGQGQGGVNEDTLATKLKADLEQISGLTVTLVPMDPTAWITDYRASKLQFTLAPWGPDYPDVLSYAEPFGATDGGVAQRVGYTNPEIDALLDQIGGEPDAVKRTEGYAEIQRILLDDMPYVVLFQPTDQRAASANVEGVTTHFLYGIQLRFASKSA